MIFALPVILVFILSLFTEPGPLPHTDTPGDCRTCSQELTAEQVWKIEKYHKGLIRKINRGKIVD